MAAADKAKLVKEIELKIQSLTLLLSVIKADRSRKDETLTAYQKQYEELLRVKNK